MRAHPTGAAALLVAASLAVSGIAAAQSPAPSPSAAPSAAPSATPAGSPEASPEATPRATPDVGTPAPSGAPTTEAPGTAAPASPDAAGSATPEPTLTAAQRRIPPEVRAAADAWPLPNQDYTGKRKAAGSPIDSTSVDRLGVAWTASLPDQSAFGYGGYATNPLVLDGRVYIQDLTSDVHVYDLQTGEVTWETPDWNESQLGPNGVAVGYGNVYAIDGEHEVVALSMEDGSQVWSTDLRTQNDSEGITIQPILFDGRLYLSTVPGSSSSNFYSGGVSGLLYALDAETGEIVWSFDTDASGDLWGNREVNSGGGAWYPPTIDIRDRTTFWGIGNPAPYPGTEEFPAGSSRPGPNRWTNSVLALNPDGSLDWGTQVRPGDLFDLDFQLPPILATVQIDGEDRRIVLGGGKNGEVVAFDRDDGEILWRTQVGRHENDDVTEIPEEGITIFPGTLGGVETPMAFDAGILYAPYVDVSTTYTPSAITGVGLDDDNGGVVAVDAITGEILWDVPFDSMVLGAVTVVNDLLLTSTYDGRILFLDKATGEVVWSQQAPAGINGWPAVVGDTVLIPAGVGAEPMLIALRLDAEDTLPSPAPVASPAASPAPGATIAPVASPGGPAGPVSPSPDLGSPEPIASPAAGSPVASGSPAAGSPAASGSPVVPGSPAASG